MMRLINKKTSRTVCVENGAVNRMIDSGKYRLADKTDRSMKPGRAKNYKTK